MTTTVLLQQNIPVYKTVLPAGFVDLNGNSIAGSFAYIPSTMLVGADGVSPASASNGLPSSSINTAAAQKTFTPNTAAYATGYAFGPLKT